jgi:hypothetical protein
MLFIRLPIRLNPLNAGIIPLFILGMLMTGCRIREKGETVDTPGRLASEQNKHEFKRELEQVNPGLRDPAAVIELIRMTGATFQENLVNRLDRDSVYLLDSVLSVMNLGIYTVDIAYLVSYDRDEDVMLYLQKARALAENIRAGHLYDHGMFRRYQVAGVPKDSLMMILKHAAEQLEHDFSRMELMRIYTLFATGEFIEKLHLTAQLLVHADYENDASYLSLMLLFFHQENSLRQLLSLLDQVRRKEEGERFMAMLSDLQLIFMELNTSDELAGINTSNITENQIFKDLVAQIDRIRKQIIDPVYP